MNAAAHNVVIYTDGGCAPTNPGPGGWAAILIKGAHRKELKGGEPHTTNNRMELTAALMALRALQRPCRVTVFTDSRYLCNAFGKRWIEKWQRNGWRTADKKPVLNADLWRELIEQTKVHAVTWNWVEGHADNVQNNRADALAVAAREALAAGLVGTR